MGSTEGLGDGVCPSAGSVGVALGANIGEYRSGEWALCQPLLASLKPGMLCMADRGFNGFEHTVNSHINRLRNKIETDPRSPSCIVTVWGVGYRFDPPEPA